MSDLELLAILVALLSFSNFPMILPRKKNHTDLVLRLACWTYQIEAEAEVVQTDLSRTITLTEMLSINRSRVFHLDCVMLHMSTPYHASHLSIS